jgi:hypothetical protein
MNLRRRYRRRLSRPLALCWLLTVIAASLFAGGRQDQNISRADELIRAKRYDEAILLLTEHVKKNPENFAAAEKRIQQIVKIRNEYNMTADELLDTVISDPENTEKILALTRRLEALEDASNPQVQIFVTRTRDIALFRFNEARLRRILVEGRELIDRGSWKEALAVYASGMDIYRDDFFAGGYGEQIENRVNQGIRDVGTVVESFPGLALSLDAAAAEMAQEGSRGAQAARLEDIFNGAASALDRLIELDGSLYTTVDYFDTQLEQIRQQDSAVGDRSFLSFAARLIYGRSARQSGEGEEPAVQEGMIGVLEGYWSSLLSGMENSAADLAGRYYTAALDQARNRNYESSRAGFMTAETYLSLPLVIIDKWQQFRENRDPPVISLYGRSVLTEKGRDFLACESFRRSIAWLVEGTNIGARYEEGRIGDGAGLPRDGEPEGDGNLRVEEEFQDRALAALTDLDVLLGEVNAGTEELEALQGMLPPENRDQYVFSRYNTTRSFLRGLRSRIVEEEAASAVRYFTIVNGGLADRVAGRRAELEEGNRLIQGIPQEDGGGPILYYPAEGLAILTGMEGELADDRRAAETLLARYAAEPPENLNGGVLQGLYTAAVSMAAELDAMSLREQGLAADARTRIAQADAYSLDGDRLFLESQNALGRSNFEVARDRIQRAAERYGASLTIQEDAGRRAAWDARILGLGNEIDRIENEIIIQDVRNLVNNARVAYFAGNFEQAEELLVRAQNRWRITNVEDDTEVAYWLNMVRGALSLRSGRVIPPTAPLYAEMSQLLSEAKTNYDEGVRLLNTNRRAEGLAKFAEARQKTREVRLMFPVNKEAGILELRMDQVTDREAFDRSFGQRFREAVAGTRPNVRSSEAFADLQNLAEINPGYPGMSAAVTQAEIDMGFRPPPPDPRDLARSRELTAAARGIVEGNITVQFDVALAQLNQAIQLDPGNAQATSLKDQLQTRMGGGSGSLDTASEAEYRRAVQEYQQGRLLVALSIVQQLLQNPRNRNSVRILELERRIQSVL